MNEKLAALGGRTGGVWTRAEALAALSEDAVRGRLERGEWQRLLPGAYADAGVEPDAAMWAWAVLRTSGEGAVLRARTAARTWGLPLVDDDDPATGRHEATEHDVHVPNHRGSRSWRERGSSPRGTVHRSQLVLRPGEVVEPEPGLRITSVARTLQDLAREIRLDALVCAVDAALHRGLTSPVALEAQVAAAKGTRQAVAFRTAVALADGRAESPAETLARLALKPLLPGLVPQHEVRTQWGALIARLDLAEPDLRLAVEVDGKRNHAGAQMAARDHRRDRRTGQLGWWTERVTWYELRREQAAFIARVMRAVAARAA